MSTLPQSVNAALDRLIERWGRLQPRRAYGGWWALAGFSFQAIEFLRHIFERCGGRGATEWRAEFERLSDLLTVDDDRVVFVQSKLTLTNNTLRDAVAEAYHIVDTCMGDTVTAQLLPNVRFRIACGRNESTVAVAALKMGGVVPNGVAAVWDATVQRFDPPSVTPGGPAGAGELLWQALAARGVLDPDALVNASLGELMRSVPSGAVPPVQIADRLRQAFDAAPKVVGEFLTAGAGPPPDGSTAVLTGQRPKLAHLRRGFFRDRPAVFDRAWRPFTKWLADPIGTTALKIPVFWVGGRSGDGKSVLTLQLAARLRVADPDLRILVLGDVSEFPRLLARLPRDAGAGAGVAAARPRPLLVIVDDIYAARQASWDADVRSAAAVAAAGSVLVLTCGPSEQMREFKARLADDVEVVGHTIGRLDEVERAAFAAWYVARTGSTPTPRRRFGPGADVLLVQFMFELSQGRSLTEFAGRFADRLRGTGLFEVVRRIVAANALYIDAPGSLLADEAARRRLLAVAADEHFAVDEDAVGVRSARLIHPHLAWQLVAAWSDAESDPRGSALWWAEDLAAVTAALAADGQWDAVNEVLSRLMSSTRLSGRSRRPDPDRAEAVADHRAFWPELYRTHVRVGGGRLPAETVHRWLEVAARLPDVRLVPPPVDWFVQHVGGPDAGAEIRGIAAFHAWRTGGGRVPPPGVRAAIERYVAAHPDRPGVASALGQLLRGGGNDAVVRLARSWLDANGGRPSAHHVLDPLLATAGSDDRLHGMALRWLRDHRDYPTSHVVAERIALEQAWRRDVMTAVMDWADATPPARSARAVLFVLRSGRQREATRRRVAGWLGRAGGDTAASTVRALLAAPALGQPTTLTAPQTPHQPETANGPRALVDQLRADPGFAPAWDAVRKHMAGHPTSAGTRRLLVTLASDPAMRPRAVSLVAEWLGRHGDHPGSGQLAAALSTGEGPAAALAAASDWASEHPADPNWPTVTGTLAKAGVPRANEQLTHWIGANLEHPAATNALTVLLTRDGTRADLMGYAERMFLAPANPNRVELVRACLAATGGAAVWVGRAIRLYRDLPGSMQRTMYRSLGDALVRSAANVTAALRATTPAEADLVRKAVASALRRGLGGTPAQARDFLGAVPPPHAGIIAKLVRA